MTNDARLTLEMEIARFRAWLDTQDPRELSDEWESHYAGWCSLYDAVDQFVTTIPCQQWDSTAIEMLLYALAHDNEVQWIVEAIAQNPVNVMFLAEHSLPSGEWKTKWQLADRISQLDPLPPTAESLLVQFVHDEDEYVRRRALLALARIESPLVEALAGPAWDTGDEYQRIAVLCVLDRIGSPQVARYTAMAEEDGRQYLAIYAKELRENGTLQDLRIQGIPVSF